MEGIGIVARKQLIHLSNNAVPHGKGDAHEVGAGSEGIELWAEPELILGRNLSGRFRKRFHVSF